MVAISHSGGKIGQVTPGDFSGVNKDIFHGTKASDRITLDAASNGKRFDLYRGNDHVVLENTLQQAAVIYGYSGNDTFVANRGSKSAIGGGAGNDYLAVTDNIEDVTLSRGSKEGYWKFTSSNGTEIEFKDIEQFRFNNDNGRIRSKEEMAEYFRTHGQTG